ncbi:hypothetical protein N8I77_009542 [Diaporthe amygdali]|uniref:SsuA/THI5-like domain-containing protein n=1 Tax=Phomopsis amygdali TaxID=1214568 RepID=A0AAD9SA12_PHOAM|nr:hypothetical protein N8I77_009542 [Diaporthe amygdali]
MLIQTVVVTMKLSAFPVSLLATAVSALRTVQYGAFLPTATYSVANQLGFFTANGLNVVFNQVASSTDAFNSILNGQYDILTATVDNALNYRFNQNQNVTVLGQLDQGPDLVIASVPSITDISQLKGKPIIVDSPLSGYSYLLQYVLSKAGLTLANGDFSFMTVGGTSTRYADLLNGTLPNGTAVYATILNYPFTVESQSLPAGEAPNVLARVSDYVAPITSSAFTVRESSLSNKTESALLARFLASMYAANRYLLNPANANCSVRAIAKQLGVSTDVAWQEYTSVTDPVSGEISPAGDFTFNMEGLLNDVMVRSSFGGFSSISDDFNFTEALQPGTGKLIDYSVRNAAVDLWWRDRVALTRSYEAHAMCKHPDRTRSSNEWYEHRQIEPCRDSRLAMKHSRRNPEESYCDAEDCRWRAEVNHGLDLFCATCDNAYGVNGDRLDSATNLYSAFKTKRSDWEYYGKLSDAETDTIRRDAEAQLRRYHEVTDQGPYNNSYATLCNLLEEYTLTWNNYLDAKLKEEQRKQLEREDAEIWREARLSNRLSDAMETVIYPAGRNDYSSHPARQRSPPRRRHNGPSSRSDDRNCVTM